MCQVIRPVEKTFWSSQQGWVWTDQQHRAAWPKCLFLVVMIRFGPCNLRFQLFLLWMWLGFSGLKPFKITTISGRPHGWVVKFARSTEAAQGFTGLDPGRWHGTTWSGHIEEASHVPQLEWPATKIYNYVSGGFWEIKQKKKKIGNSC